MADFTKTVMEAVSKYMQKGPVHSQFNTETALFDFLKKRAENHGGRSWLRAVRVSGLSGVGNRAEGSALPTAKATAYKELVITPQYTYKPISISNVAREFATTDPGAFVDVVVESVQWATKALARDCARQLWGSPAGQLCVVNGAVSDSTAVTVDGPGTLYLHEGMDLDVGSGSTAVTVASVDTKTVFSATTNVTLTNDSVVYLDGNKDQEVVGLNAIFYDGTNDLGLGATPSIYGLTRSTDTWTYPYIGTSVGNGVTQKFQIAISQARVKGGGNTKVILCPPGVFTSIYLANKSLTRFGVPVTGAGEWTIHAGHRKMDFNGIPMVDDPMAIATGNDATDTGVAVFLDTDFLEIYWTREPHLLCEWTPANTTDTEFSRMGVYWGGIVCTNFRAQSALTGITLHNTNAS
jgi:hypothetical protein